MPSSPAHKSKRKKNMAVLAAILSFIAIFWIITMVKIAGNKGATSTTTEKTAPLKSGEVAIN
jgi:hypothetical protein